MLDRGRHTARHGGKAAAGATRLGVRALAVLAAYAVALCLAVAMPTSALAFESEVPGAPGGLPCTACHGGESGTTTTTVAPTRKGPHGGYTTGTSKCESCHFLHNAPTDASLMPAQTIKATCELCHDGTGGSGVYGVIKARTGRDPGSAHRIDTTNTVPSGSVAGEATMKFSGENEYLTCSDCHSPHDSNTIEPFVGDRLRTADGTVTAAPTNRLLRKRPGGAAADVSVYGSSWCGTCHQGAVDPAAHAGRMGDHSVATETAGVWYSKVARVRGVETTATEIGALGGSNFGYVMPFPRTADQDGKGAICQQCHEDARHVGDDPAAPQQVATTEVFRITAPDGTETSDTPRFQTFPHEGELSGLVIESGDDLCLNCHPS